MCVTFSDQDYECGEVPGGTENVLTIARALGAQHYVQFSTAYVAGRRTGTILEEPVTDATDVNNAYEESKARSEMLVSEVEDLRTWIMRPGIVIGHSRTYAALTRAGLYDGLAGVAQLKSAGVERMLGDRPLHMLQLPSAPVNLIPVDAVVGAAWRIRSSDSERQIFHLTNASPPTLEEVNRAMSEPFGLREPAYVESEDELNEIEQALANSPQSRFQRPYVSTNRHFDLSNTDDAIGPAATDYPLGEENLRPYVRWFVEQRLGDAATPGRVEASAR